DEEINMILEAGLWAPSASNRQPWEFIVIKNKDIIKKLAEITFYGMFIMQAPVHILLPFVLVNILNAWVLELG
ncbi:unnamed protein product, partial [marine sediment metagenome]